jgi:hypothetical protein
MHTKKYLAKSDIGTPGIANKESVNFFKISQDVKEKKEKKPCMSEPDFLLPMST